VSLVTRGLGTSSRIITIGFGGISVDDKIQRLGRSSYRYDHLLRESKIDSFTITAMLISVNDKRLKLQSQKTVRGIVDKNDNFSMKQSGKIRITKTKPKEGIFIKVIKFFKRE